MARPAKFPGLQQRYEAALKEILSDGSALKAREIVDAVRSNAAVFSITEPECDDLGANFANYTARAKTAGVLISDGPWAGYRLVPTAGAVSKASGLAPIAALEPSGAPAGETDTERKYQFWESFLHLPVTIALSSQFGARVVSLQNAADLVRWGNPDMLMLRASALERLSDFDPELRVDLFGMVDATPECILASIEVKGGSIGIERSCSRRSLRQRRTRDGRMKPGSSSWMGSRGTRRWTRT